MALALASAETRESEAAILYVTPLASFAKGRREIKGWIFGVRKLDGLLRPFRHAAVEIAQIVAHLLRHLALTRYGVQDLALVRFGLELQCDGVTFGDSPPTRSERQ
jgi:hypothetical protein